MVFVILFSNVGFFIHCLSGKQLRYIETSQGKHWLASDCFHFKLCHSTSCALNLHLVCIITGKLSYIPCTIKTMHKSTNHKHIIQSFPPILSERSSLKFSLKCHAIILTQYRPLSLGRKLNILSLTPCRTYIALFAV